MKNHLEYRGIIISLSIALSVAFIGCGDDSIEKSEVLQLEVPESVIGDGISEHKIKATLDSRSAKERRKIKFKTQAGSFKGASTENPQTITVDAVFYNQELYAEATWKVPANSGSVEISAEPAIDGLGGLYLVSSIISVDTSVVHSISLSANSFSVYNNFDGEVTLTGALKNKNGSGVSAGTKVVVEDIFETTKDPVNGRFRSGQLASNSSSTVSIIYSAGVIAPGQNILLIATVLDQNGDKTSIADTVKIFVNQKLN